MREMRAEDWPAVWRIVAPSISEDEARALWLELPQATFVAVDDEGAILGTYYIKPNHTGGGAHVCNCGYIVDEQARGRGVASAMCAHSQGEGAARGFRAMQFNFVVSTNETAVRLWKRHGFEAFLHPEQGYVDAFVMYKCLDARSALLQEVKDGT